MTQAASIIVRTQALASATRTLEAAAAFASVHAPCKLIFQKQMRRPGSPPVAVRMLWPGVLQVFDPKTGEMLAESEPGKPEQLRAGFQPNGLRVGAL